MVKLTDTLQHGFNWIYKWIPQPQPSPEKLKKVKIVAHRGAWNLIERLENTIPAFDYCLHKNIWAIELDIRWTKDNVPIIHHDKNTQRVFKKNFTISELNFSDLREILPQIPRLSEVISLYQGKLHFMIELKDQLTSAQVDILKSELSYLKPCDDYHLMSLDISRFKNIDFVGAKAFVSIARMNIYKVFHDTIKNDLGALTGQYLLLTQNMKETCHRQGIKVGTGFPSSKNSFYREVNRGVDWIFTNDATELSKLIEL